MIPFPVLSVLCLSLNLSDMFLLSNDKWTLTRNLCVSVCTVCLWLTSVLHVLTQNTHS